MTTLLPMGEEATAARTRLLLSYAQQIQDQLPLPVGQPELDGVVQALEAVRNEPTRVDLWTAVEGPAHFAYLNGCRSQSPHAEQWRKVSAAAKQGQYMAHRMRAIEEANAPICTEHGPMANSSDPAIAANGYGDRWHCPDGPDCKARYWWFDGTYFARRTS